MDWQLELLFAGRTVLAAVLGGIIGIERFLHGSEVGVRTYASVAMGACVFGLISQHIPGAEPSRIAANIVTGVGFLGAGIILHQKGRVVGLTTAATVWATAAIGTGVAFGMYVLSALSTVIVFAVLVAHHVPWLSSRDHDHDHPESDELD